MISLRDPLLMKYANVNTKEFVGVNLPSYITHINACLLFGTTKIINCVNVHMETIHLSNDIYIIISLNFKLQNKS